MNVDMADIRIAQPADDRQVADILTRGFSHLYASMGLKMSPERQAYLEDLSSRRSFSITFIYGFGGAGVGTVTIVPPSEHCKAWIDRAWEMRLLAVDPTMRRRGIARQLVGQAEQEAEAAGAATMCLHARRGMAVQAQFYPACGYVRDTAGDLDIEPFQEGYSKSLGNFVTRRARGPGHLG